jgi:NAD(P)-dependent dehydrogenase (short-subunit alcohol dehydrogenase family)
VTDAVYPSLAGRKVVVTGGATGIGAALVEAFARQGSRVVFLDIDEPAGSSLATRIEPASFIPCDLRDIAALTAALATAEASLGGIDVLLNNAASDDRHTLDEVTPDYWDERMATNLRHLFFAAQAVVPAMRTAGGGAIVNFGSISWHLGLASLVVYQTAKAGIEGLTRSLARELGRDNIRVTTIIPGGVQTPRQAKWYTPEAEEEIVAAQCLNARIQPGDVAALALFLASDDARMCTGHEYFVDAGWR